MTDIAGTLIPAFDGDRLRPMDKIDVHRRGVKHPAVSVFVLDGDAVLLQRRAMGKYHTPGLWANACCTHPHWGESAAACAGRRLREELGVGGLNLRHAGQVEYRANVGNGMVEHELVEVFVANAGRNLVLRPSPAEVMDTRWLTFDALDAERALRPGDFTPWLHIYLAHHRAMISGALRAEK